MIFAASTQSTPLLVLCLCHSLSISITLLKSTSVLSDVNMRLRLSIVMHHNSNKRSSPTGIYVKRGTAPLIDCIIVLMERFIVLMERIIVSMIECIVYANVSLHNHFA